jgi:hypothetical protein
MRSATRPVSVLIIACLYIAVGAVGLARHFPKLRAVHQDDVWIELTELLAAVFGILVLCGRNWARWLAIAWMAFHVAISFPVARAVVVHSLILVLVAWGLFHPAANRFFAARRLSADAPST